MKSRCFAHPAAMLQNKLLIRNGLWVSFGHGQKAQMPRLQKDGYRKALRVRVWFGRRSQRRRGQGPGETARGLGALSGDGCPEEGPDEMNFAKNLDHIVDANKTTTPRTDAEAWDETGKGNELVDANVARQLKRELAEAREYIRARPPIQCEKYGIEDHDAACCCEECKLWRKAAGLEVENTKPSGGLPSAPAIGSAGGDA